MLNYFPKYFTNRAIYLYLAVLLVVSVLFFSNIMSWYWFIFGMIEVVGFFYFSNVYTKKWNNISEKTFRRKIFVTALTIRLVWVVFSYFFYDYMTGSPFEFSAADSLGYHDNGGWVATLLRDGKGYSAFLNSLQGRYSDAGYSLYLGTLYSFFGNESVLIVRIIKALLSAYTCILIYNLATRNFGDSAGRIAAVLCVLMPSLIYYCGLHLKETEMVFLTIAFVERADYAMRSKKFTFSNLILPILLAAGLFFFRTVLGAAALFAFFTALVFVPGRTLKGWKRLVLVGWVSVAVLYFMGGRIATEIESVWEDRQGNQSSSMEWRSQREGGNEYARYMSGAIFAPMIFIIPFPTVIDIPVQQNQQLLNGGNFDKNIIAFFVMFALITVIRRKEWRNYALIGSFVLAYLFVIAMSAFAHSERFHQPVVPLELLMAAYGISMVTNKTKKYYNIYLIFIFVAIIGWSWFKLSGRGLI